MKYRIESDDQRHQRQGPPGVIGTARDFRLKLDLAPPQPNENDEAQDVSNNASDEVSIT